jgi:hypothetical protein
MSAARAGPLWLELPARLRRAGGGSKAESLFPGPPRQPTRLDASFPALQPDALPESAQDRRAGGAVELLDPPRAGLSQRLKGTLAEALIAPRTSRARRIVATVANAVNPFRSYPPPPAGTESSARDGPGPHGILKRGLWF